MTVISNALPKAGYLYISDDVKLRKEYFGGLIFNRQTGATLEVDNEAYHFLCWLKDIKRVHSDVFLKHQQIRNILPLLLSAGIIAICDKAENYHSKDIHVPNFDNDLQGCAKVLSAPETVHLAATYHCRENCLDCYARGYSTNGELDTAAMCAIIDDIVKQGVFQLAIGGGEPFIRQDLKDIVHYASIKGLVVHITTGQYHFNHRLAEVLRHVKSLHVGVRSELILKDTSNNAANLQGLVEYASEANILAGANLITTRFTIHNLRRIVESLVSCGFKRLIFLRYKPGGDSIRWHNESPGKDDLRIFKDGLLLIKRRYPHLMVRLDCASAFLMKKIGSQTALRAGIKGCVAGDRILSVSPDGSVYPCSQLVSAELKAGNLTRNSLEVIWRESNVLNRYRGFRQSASFNNSVCGTCTAKEFCGGCRVFAKDTLGGESVCPLG